MMVDPTLGHARGDACGCHDGVLVVDDDEDIRNAVAMVLRDEGYRVAVASDGERALQELETHRPCLILIDLIMPCMDGLTLLERLRCDERFAGVPVAMLSAGSIRNPPAGVPFLSKPFALDNLIGFVESHCSCPRRCERDATATTA